MTIIREERIGDCRLILGGSTFCGGVGHVLPDSLFQGFQFYCLLCSRFCDAQFHEVPACGLYAAPSQTYVPALGGFPHKSLTLESRIHSHHAIYRLYNGGYQVRTFFVFLFAHTRNLSQARASVSAKGQAERFRNHICKAINDLAVYVCCVPSNLKRLTFQNGDRLNRRFPFFGHFVRYI